MPGAARVFRHPVWPLLAIVVAIGFLLFTPSPGRWLFSAVWFAAAAVWSASVRKRAGQSQES